MSAASGPPVRAGQGRATTFVGLVVVATLLAAASLGLIGYRAIRRYTAGKNVTRTFQRLPVTPTGLWATVAADGSLGGLYAVVDRSDGPGGSLVSIPIFASSADATSPAPLAATYSSDGQEGLVAAVESAVRVSFDVVQFSSTGQVAQLMAPLAPLAVTLPNDVPSANASSAPALTSGQHDLSAEEIAAVLTSPGRGTDESRAGNVAAVLTALSAKLSAEPATAPPGAASTRATTTPGTGTTVMAAPTTVADLLGRMAGGPVASKVLGTITSTGSATASPSSVADSVPATVQFPAIDLLASILVFASIAPANMSAPATGLVYRLEAPPGSEQRIMDAIALILYLGGNVTQVQVTDGPRRAETVVTVYQPRDRDKLATSSPLFGKVAFGPVGTPIEGIDAVISLGDEYLHMPSQRPASLEPQGTTASTQGG